MRPPTDEELALISAEILRRVQDRLLSLPFQLTDDPKGRARLEEIVRLARREALLEFCDGVEGWPDMRVVYDSPRQPALEWSPVPLPPDALRVRERLLEDYEMMAGAQRDAKIARDDARELLVEAALAFFDAQETTATQLMLKEYLYFQEAVKKYRSL